MLAFVIKESTFKAWSRPGSQVLDFHDVTVVATNGTFTSTVHGDSPVAEHFKGRYAMWNGRWVALATAVGLR